MRTGYTRYPLTNFKTTTHCIAYLDILGGKNNICTDSEHKFLNFLNMLYEDAIFESQVFADKKDIFVKIFSDNILFAVKVDFDSDNYLKQITTLINLVANIQNEALRYGYLIRGAIVQDEFFYNNILVYGKAIVRAVEMEENEAKYPRVIVQEELAQLLPQYFFQDKDCKIVLNHLLLSQSEEYISFKLQLLKMLKNHGQEEKIKNKIMWVIDYFNSWYGSPSSGSLENPQITEDEIQEALNGYV